MFVRIKRNFVDFSFFVLKPYDFDVVNIFYLTTLTRAAFKRGGESGGDEEGK